ncbi:ABC transporter permease [Patulibacter brassicae]|uniref:ABC transporter permease n=1 Tax=Patulibacter brassicae TaxID=1705717 RepID=A0ABU4VQY4_9ACTN|nr:ABC transporter permease [Patulibacter brassicae]MDX8153782.1 ABC transporter permease [Patulibacter brassicae]
MLRLLGLALSRAVRPPFDYAPEFVEQFRFALKIAIFPLIITSFALSFGPAGIQASNFLGLFGALDRMGGIYVLIVVRFFSPLVTAIVVAGAVGTAITADLGARKVREEVDALSVLGIDTVKSLVVPRLLAIVAICLLFNVFALLAGVAGAVVVVLQNGAPLGPFFSAFFSSATTLELAASFLKCALFGAMIATVCCYKGINASGGAEGVGRAVNQAVVTAFLLIGAIDYTFTQILLATNPILSEVR